MLDSLLQSVNKISKNNKKISQIYKEELKKKIIVSEIDNKILINSFLNTYQLCNKDINKSNLLLRKSVYPYEHMDSREKFNETSLSNKECYYSKVNKEHITDEDFFMLKKYETYLK